MCCCVLPAVKQPHGMEVRHYHWRLINIFPSTSYVITMSFLSLLFESLFLTIFLFSSKKKIKTNKKPTYLLLQAGNQSRQCWSFHSFSICGKDCLKTLFPREIWSTFSSCKAWIIALHITLSPVSDWGTRRKNKTKFTIYKITLIALLEKV